MPPPTTAAWTTTSGRAARKAAAVAVRSSRSSSPRRGASTTAPRAARLRQSAWPRKPCPPVGVAERQQAQGGDELAEAALDVDLGLEARGADPAVVDLIVAAVFVFAELGEVDEEVEALAQQADDVSLGVVERVVADVVDVVVQAIPVGERVLDGPGDVVDMQEGAPELALVDDEVLSVDGLPGEVVDHQVEAHAVAGAKGGGEAQRHAVGAGPHDGLGLGLGLAIEREGVEGGVLGADADDLAIVGAGAGVDHARGGRGQLGDVAGAVDVDLAGLPGELLAEGVADQGGEVHDAVGAFELAGQGGAIGDVDLGEAEVGLDEVGEEGLTAEEEAVHDVDRGTRVLPM